MPPSGAQVHDEGLQILENIVNIRVPVIVHFIQPLKERIVQEVGYGLSLEGASAADLVNQCERRVNLPLRKENPHEQHEEQFIRRVI